MQELIDAIAANPPQERIAMGSDASARVFYGFTLPKLACDYHDLNDLWEEEKRPAKPSRPHESPEWDTWRESVQQWNNSPEHVRIDWGGSDECSTYFVHCPRHETKVFWGDVEPVETHNNPELAIAKAHLHEFCDKFNLPKKEPGWFLSARNF